jgi:hypothetical protein
MTSKIKVELMKLTETNFAIYALTVKTICRMQGWEDILNEKKKRPEPLSADLPEAMRIARDAEIQEYDLANNTIFGLLVTSQEPGTDGERLCTAANVGDGVGLWRTLQAAFDPITLNRLASYVEALLSVKLSSSIVTICP